MQKPNTSDFILRLAAIFQENDIACEVTGENRITAEDEGSSFDITIEQIDGDIRANDKNDK